MATAELASKRSTTPDKLRTRPARRSGHDHRQDIEERCGRAVFVGHGTGEDLRRYLKKQPITARPDTLTYRAAKFIWRNGTAVALATLTVIAFTAGIVGTLIETKNARTQRDFALRQMKQAEALDEFHQFLLSDAAPSGKPFT